MDQEGFLAVVFFDVAVWDARLEVQDVIGVCTEGGEDAFDLGVLEQKLVLAFHVLSPLWIYFVKFFAFLVEIREEVGVLLFLLCAEFVEVLFWFCHGG